MNGAAGQASQLAVPHVPVWISLARSIDFTLRHAADAPPLATVLSERAPFIERERGLAKACPFGGGGELFSYLHPAQDWEHCPAPCRLMRSYFTVEGNTLPTHTQTHSHTHKHTHARTQTNKPTELH